jgi:hypothetical protein
MTSDLKHEVSPRVAQLIVNIREALIQDDIADAWHNLYQIVSPNFDLTSEEFEKQWIELERIASFNNLNK